MSRGKTTRNGNGHGTSTLTDSSLSGSMPVHRPAASLPLPPTLNDRIARGDVTAVVSFAGQGNGWLDEMAVLFSESPAAAELIRRADQVFAELLEDERLRWSGRYSQGVELVRWIAQPGTRPEASYLASSALSMPLIFVAQMARFAATIEEGFDVAFNQATAVTGHSQGIMAALLAAESAGPIDPDRFADYTRAIVWQGFHMDESGPEPAGGLTPMAAISGVELPALEAIVQAFNQRRPADRQVAIALHNTFNRFVLSGDPAALAALQTSLEKRAAAEKDKKKAGKLGGRPLQFTWEFLPVSAPFHSPFMAAGLEAMRTTLEEIDFHIDAGSLQVDVIDCADGTRFNDASAVAEKAMVSQFVAPVTWCDTLNLIAKARQPDVVLDLGPGDGVAKLSASCLRGRGVEMVALTTARGRQRLFTRGVEDSGFQTPLDYREFAPRTVRLRNQKAALSNKFTRATGRPPVILPGMTPTTVDARVVAAAANAGYVAELAGGGQVTERIFNLRMGELKTLLKPGQEVVFNALYLDPYLWDLHFVKGLVQNAKKAGAPLCGVTISAGVPPLEESVELLHELNGIGLWLNAFKPGTVDQVAQVLKIAAAVPEYTVFLHLEGGLAGGHHSWESLDQLLLATYDKIRRQDNVVLCVGGGIADEERARELLQGTWAKGYGRPIMPVDAVFLGTVTMAALETTTSEAVKEALASTAGTEDWVYRGVANGGMTSGLSQLNADIHYVNNAAARCGRLLDQVAGNADAVAKRRHEIVDALNKTAKPCFGDLDQMTYADVLARLIELMATGRNGRYEDGVWPDRTWRIRVADFVQRAEARLSDEAFDSLVDRELTALDSPKLLLAAFLERYAAADRPLHPADQDWFVTELCARPGKPVSFVPVIDADVRRWYKSDSLWQAHDDRYDADQVLVIPGPAAVRGIRQANEPISSILGRFASVEATNGNAEETEWLYGPAEQQRPGLPTGYSSSLEDGVLTLEPTSQDAVSWFDYLACGFDGPLAALCRTPQIFVGDVSRPNPLRTLARPRPKSSLKLNLDDGALNRLEYAPAGGREALTVEPANGGVTLTLSVPGATARAELNLHLELGENVTWPHFSISNSSWDQAIADFYLAALFAEAPKATELFESSEQQVTVDPHRSLGYAAITGHPRGETPLNYAFSTVWKSLFGILGSRELASGMLRLVHLRNAVKQGPGWPLKAGEEVTTGSRLLELRDESRGRTIVTHSTISRGDALVAEVESEFFVRGHFGNTEARVRAAGDHTLTLDLQTAADLDWLCNQPWIELDADNITLPTTLDASLEASHTIRRDGRSESTASGVLSLHGEAIGHIALDDTGHAEKNPVLAALDLLASDAEESVSLTSRTLAEGTITAPLELEDFAQTSLDFNPIHRSELAARLASLDGPIVHGMWTAASLQAFVVRKVCGGNAGRVASFDASFLAPVAPGANLQLKAVRRAARDGRLILEATATVLPAEADGTPTPAVRATVELAAPTTAYVFPGQGIQQQGMGMEGYQRSAAARQIWDRADTLTREKLGFSVLEVVRNNPRELLVDGVRNTHPKGVLNLTQFTQVAMAVLASAQVAELDESGLLVPNAVTCGHSVGEYNALAAVSGVMSLENVIELVYQRGMAMHRLVPRDARGRSAYAMGVVRPHYAGLSHQQAEELVARIGEETGHFLQIVNYNIKGRQYSVTGELPALKALGSTLRELNPGARKDPFILVPGIDVPFHSKVLRDGVPAFAAVLEDKLPPESDYLKLIGGYIPNLVARPFALTTEFVDAIIEVTNSQSAKEIRDQWESRLEHPNALARSLLIELLAWQFASPVRWIETQDFLLMGSQAEEHTDNDEGRSTKADNSSEFGVGAMAAMDRIIEVGVGYQPTLANMARATLVGIPNAGPIEILNVEAESEAVFLTDEDPIVELVETTTSGPTEESGGDDAKREAAAQTENPSAMESSAANLGAAPRATGDARRATSAPTDQKLSHLEGLKTILAVQAKLRPEQLTDDETIDDVFEGVSSRRNQVLMDLGAEFDLGAIDGAHEKPLTALADELATRAARWSAPGPYLKSTQDEALRRVLGRAGMNRNDVVSYLADTFGFGVGLVAHTINRLALESREGQSARGGALGQLADEQPANKNGAHDLLDAAAALVADDLGFALTRAGGGETAAAAVDAAVVQELEEKVLGEEGVLMDVARKMAERMGHELDATPAASFEDDAASALDTELGEELASWVSPVFDPLKHVVLDSAWAWARRDVATTWYDAINGRIDVEEAERRLQELAVHAGVKGMADTAAWFADKCQKLADNDEWLEGAHEGEEIDLDTLRAAFHELQKKAENTDGIEVPWPVVPTKPVLETGAGELDYREEPAGDLAVFRETCAELLDAGYERYGADGELTGELVSALEAAESTAMDFRGKTALVNGASPGSIAIEVVRHLLRGGARVVLTTSSHRCERIRYYREVYHEAAAPGAELHIVPCNQGSKQDVDALVSWLFSEVTEQAGPVVKVVKPAFDVDILVPFGAIGDAATADQLGTRAEAAIRVMLLGVERLVTGIATERKQRGPRDRKVHVLLPLSPNHGAFGGDGAYAETKAALETLLYKWHSEQDAWAAGCSLVGARIGWVRGTGLMDANNPLAARLEERGDIKTFSSAEMGLLLSALCTERFQELAVHAPIQSDLTAGFDSIPNLRAVVDGIRGELEAEVATAKRQEMLGSALDEVLRTDAPDGSGNESVSGLRSALPGWPRRSVERGPIRAWNRDVKASLDDTVVIVGIGEVGPCGSSRTRWELEVDEALSPAGVMELAWITGLIRYDSEGRRKTWIDVETGEPVAEADIAERYGEAVKNAAGIRMVDADTAGYDPESAPVLVEAYLDRDFTFPVTSREEARVFVETDPENTSARYDQDADQWFVTRKKGTVVRVPKKVQLSRRVAGILPTGWDFGKLGIPADMLESVDRLTLFNIAATIDAFLSAGLSPEELLSRIHPARVANTQGAGLGGMQSIKRMYQDHVLNQERQSDVLQESLINVMAGYIVQGFVGSYGAMAHPVGACATAAVSLEEGSDKILAGRADFVVAGAYDDIGEEGMVGFGDMNATANTEEMLSRGIEPAAMSRANDRRRRGFVEAHGGGTVLLARASVAAELGLPVYGVLAWSGSFGDGIHKSIPAPGMGILAAACGGEHSPLATAMQRFGITADDIGVVYKHDTSTAANDPNENDLHNRIQNALGRTPGNPLWVVSQKTLTGHSKGGAAAWQMGGLLQTLSTGRVAGNRNLESVDQEMKRFEHLTFTDSTVETGPAERFRAGVITSLGFGHVSSIALVVHPDAFAAMLADEERELWEARAQERAADEQQQRARILLDRQQAFSRRTERRFAAADGSDKQAEEEAAMLLDPNARLDLSSGLFSSARDSSNGRSLTEGKPGTAASKVNSEKRDQQTQGGAQ